MNIFNDNNITHEKVKVYLEDYTDLFKQFTKRTNFKPITVSSGIGTVSFVFKLQVHAFTVYERCNKLYMDVWVSTKASTQYESIEESPFLICITQSNNKVLFYKKDSLAFEGGENPIHNTITLIHQSSWLP